MLVHMRVFVEWKECKANVLEWLECPFRTFLVDVGNSRKALRPG